MNCFDQLEKVWTYLGFSVIDWVYANTSDQRPRWNKDARGGNTKGAILPLRQKEYGVGGTTGTFN